MVSNEITKVSAFLNQFRLLENEANAYSYETEKKSYMRFFEKVNILLKEHKEFELLNAPNYNIFSVLKINTNEPKVHTPFLYDLLNSKGEHKQGDLYFNLFIESIFKDRLENPSEITFTRLEREKSIPRGFIDLLITCSYQNKPYYILIENKIYAGDGCKQIERYYKYLVNILKLNSEQFIILYLSPNGSAPSIPYSLSQELFDNLCSNSNLILLSYTEDISGWIAKCINKSKPLSVQNILIQYLLTIKNF